MNVPILATKLYIPPTRSNLVARPLLVEKLNTSTKHGKLTLISAPAGYGKTTLLSTWVDQCDCGICWLSLDEHDNDPARFLKYLILALQRVQSDIGEPILMTLESSHSLESESLLSGLINGLSAIPERFIVVLDDYHVITEPEIQEMLLFLIDHQPIRMHLVISSRADPPWPLSRLRVRGDIIEIRAHEMRFRLEEVSAFLNDTMGLALAPQDIASMEKRTEGWVAGLQLAALSMRERLDKQSFIRAFTGSHHYIMDFLVEEVLDQIDKNIREFLIKTSILERLTGSLCDAVLGEQDSQSILLDLEKKNLFLISLDDERRWYRYHHLFADLLKNRLNQFTPEEVLELHKKASIWYGENGLLADAFIHALAANDIDRIIQLTDEMAVYKMDFSERNAFLAWLERLPDETYADHPWLAIARLWAFFNSGKFEAVNSHLERIEGMLKDRSYPVEVESRIRGHIAAIRSYMAEVRGDDAVDAMHMAEDALNLLPEKDIQLRAFVGIRWANCLAWLGDFERAISVYRDAGESSKQIGDGHLAITALSEMAVVQMLHGKLRQANENIKNIHQYAESLAKRDGRRSAAMGLLYRHMSSIKYEMNELVEANHYGRECVKICNQWGEKESLLFGLAALTRVQAAQGDYKAVEKDLEQIFKLARQISSKSLAYFRSWAIPYFLKIGELEVANQWMQELGLKADDEISFDQYLNYYSLALTLKAKGMYSNALQLVDNLLRMTTTVGAEMYTIKLYGLQAELLKYSGRNETAMAAINHALKLAQAGGYVRPILDGGEAIGELLKSAVFSGIEVDYAEKLMRMFNDEYKAPGTGSYNKTGFLDPLSNREIEVLRILITNLTTPEIADELYVSVSTVRSHIKNIYSKLGVHSRHEAVMKAKELNLI